MIWRLITCNVIQSLAVADFLVVLRIRHQNVEQFVFDSLEENVVGKRARQIDFYSVHWNENKEAAR